MVKIKKIRELKLSVLIFLGLILINYEMYIFVLSNSNFTLSLEKGTQILEVKYYDEQAWKDIVNATSNPTDWFGGNSDKIGAKGKITFLGLFRDDLNTFGAFIQLFSPWFKVPFFSILQQNGYTYEYILDRYTNYYYVWGYDFTFWSFRTEPFENYSDSTFETLFILQNPLNFANILDDYNDFAAVVNNDTVLQILNFSMPILSGNDFLWHLVMNGFTLASPINNYLTEIINTLESENVSVNENTLKFCRNGEKDYIVELFYNSMGKLDTISVKDYEGKLIYEINSTYPKFTALIILGIISGLILGLVGFSFYRKIKSKKNVISHQEKR